MVRMGTKAITVAVGLVLGAGIAVATSSDVPSRLPPADRGDEASSRPAPFGPDEPLGPEGRQVALTEAIRSGPVPAYRPQTALHSDATIVGVWVRSEGIPETFIRYESGAEVSIRPADFSEGFVAFYQGEIDQGYPGSLRKTGSVDVFLNPGTEEGASPGADMVLDGMLVEIVGHDRVTFSDVEEAAASIIATAATHGSNPGEPGTAGS